MNCPYCDNKISVFSREMNRLEKSKTCRHCGRSVNLYVSWKLLLKLMIPAAVLGAMLKLSLMEFGLPGYVGVGIATAILLFFAFRLRPAV
jgi:hypothetical protein